jgi:hypothetical protein
VKKILFLTMVILLFVGFATAKAPFTPISQDDLKDLKGEWIGERLGDRGNFERIDLKINNDSIPVKGEVTLHWEKRGIGSKTWPCKGHIENGRLIFLWAKNRRKLDLGLRTGDGEMELEGHITNKGFQGTVFLKKVHE